MGCRLGRCFAGGKLRAKVYREEGSDSGSWLLYHQLRGEKKLAQSESKRNSKKLHERMTP